MLSAEFEVRFRNWLRWCIHEGNDEPDETCGSAEGAWKSPQIWEPDPQERNLINPVDIWDALKVQRAFYGLPELQRRTIKFLHFKKWRRQWVAQKLGCCEADLSEKLYIAKRMLSNRLDMVDCKAHHARKLDTGNRGTALLGAIFL